MASQGNFAFCLNVLLVLLALDFHQCSASPTAPTTRACSQTADVVFNMYKICSRNVYIRYSNFEGQVSGEKILSGFDGYCAHQCQMFDCLRDRYRVESCTEAWQDQFFEGVNKAESICDGRRVKPAIRTMLTGLTIDTSSPKWGRCSEVAFPSISQCSGELRSSLSSDLGVENFFLHIIDLDYSESTEHMRSYLYSLTGCVYNRSIQAGCEQEWAKLITIVSLDALNTPFHFGVNTTALLLNIGTQ